MLNVGGSSEFSHTLSVRADGLPPTLTEAHMEVLSNSPHLVLRFLVPNSPKVQRIYCHNPILRTYTQSGASNLAIHWHETSHKICGFTQIKNKSIAQYSWLLLRFFSEQDNRIRGGLYTHLQASTPSETLQQGVTPEPQKDETQCLSGHPLTNSGAKLGWCRGHHEGGTQASFLCKG